MTETENTTPMSQRMGSGLYRGGAKFVRGKLPDTPAEESYSAVMNELEPVIKRLIERMTILAKIDAKIKELETMRTELVELYPKLGPYRSITELNEEIRILTDGTWDNTTNNFVRKPFVTATGEVVLIGAVGNKLDKIGQFTSGGTTTASGGLRNVENDVINHLTESQRDRITFLTEIKGYLSTYTDIYKQLDDNIPLKLHNESLKLRYPHTYVFVKPFIVLTDAQAQDFHPSTPVDEKIDVDGQVYYKLAPRTSSKTTPLPQKGGYPPGFDEYGMALEVENHSETRDEKDPHDETALLDRTIIVHHLWIDRRPDLLKVINWALNEWDMIRDDLRDGRYHPDSLTLADYTMAELCGADTMKMVTSGKGKIENRYFWTVRGKILNQTIQGQPLTRQPADKNPAFDLRDLSGDFECYNRKYYYESISDHWLDELRGEREINPKKGFCSTRGMSLYIINMTLRRAIDVENQIKKLQNISKMFDWGVDTYTNAPLQ